ncbi:hypothetical protein [Tateyamaria omphalii]|uniref:Peptidase M10 serralysin C-terminal domain-containing protein n=1 Tax=Tateyamaria omphalii TaxID=299262 RepID=A0A1P8MRQ0_9RHOB|nr:hypothetical protein [Tateyamaria omphalii]APX10704.1 hypothetical protein BWR18_02600 [Tateyamaria omphalii]
MFNDGDGRDSVTDFDTAEGDLIDLSGHGQASGFDDLSIVHSNNNAIITSDSGADRIRLEDMDIDTLSADAFIF